MNNCYHNYNILLHLSKYNALKQTFKYTIIHENIWCITIYIMNTFYNKGVTSFGFGIAWNLVIMLYLDSFLCKNCINLLAVWPNNLV